MIIKRVPGGEKVYHGVYLYSHRSNGYSEEEFEVYSSGQGATMAFFSNIYTRVATGEMLHLYVDYIVSRDYLPQMVLVEKKLGDNQTSEIYRYDREKGQVDYYFISGKEKKQYSIDSTSNFHIATPSAASSMLFIKLRKESDQGQSSHALIGSRNRWYFKAVPSPSSVLVKRPPRDTDNFRISNDVLPAFCYNIYEGLDTQAGPNKIPPVKVYISRYARIPYKIKTTDGLEIKMIEFNNLLKD